MKLFILLILVSLPLVAAVKSAKIDQVRSIDYDKGEATITFWSTNQVYRLPEDALVMPCLQNAQKAKQKVVLEMVPNTKVIRSCKLYGGGNPQL